MKLPAADLSLSRSLLLVAAFDFWYGAALVMLPPPPSLAMLTPISGALGVLLVVKSAALYYLAVASHDYRWVQRVLLLGLVLWALISLAAVVTLVGKNETISWYGIPLFGFMFVHRFLLLSYVPKKAAVT